MRRLQTSDIFSAVRVIKKAGLKEELKPVMEMAAKGKVRIEDVGMEAMLTIVEAFANKNAEDSMYELLSGPLERPLEEIKTMGLVELAEELKALAEVSDIKAFFTVLSATMRKQ